MSRFENLAAYEKSFEKMMEENKKQAGAEKGKEMEEKWKGFQDMYLSGYREIFRVW